MARRVGIAECGDDLSALYTATQLFGYGLPLTWRRFQSDIAIGGYTMTVHNHADTTLVPLGIEVAECHHVSTAGIKVAVAVKFECLCRNRQTCHGQGHQ